MSALLAGRFDRGDYPSVRAAICEAIREEILQGMLEPGKLLSIKELHDRFGVGLSAIREALCQLAADGLVIAEEQRGVRVAPISARDLDDVTKSRVHVEMITIREAVANGGMEWEAELLAAYHRVTHVLKADPLYAQHHKTFHDTLVAPCPSEWMKRFRKTLQEHSERYRRLAASHNDETRDIDGEHRGLMAAALDRDADRAAALIAEHVLETARILARNGLTKLP